MVKLFCSDCGAKNCKLWRLCGSSCPDLLCWDCVEKNQENKTFREPGSKRICNIGSYVAAIPTEEMDTYWGCTSVPQERCNWWYALPDREGQSSSRYLGEEIKVSTDLPESIEELRELTLQYRRELQLAKECFKESYERMMEDFERLMRERREHKEELARYKVKK